MACHAMHSIQDLFLESFSYALQFDMHFYMHSYVQKNFILVKSGCYNKSTYPCCNATQKMEMRWTTSMKISSRCLHCPRLIACAVGVFAAAQQESRYSLLCKDNNHVIKFI
jgi:hypothetical protein